MPMKVSSNGSGALKMAIVTDAFDPSRYDFDHAVLALGTAFEARHAGWSTCIVAATSDPGLPARLSATAQMLNLLDVSFQTVTCGHTPQSRASAVGLTLASLDLDRIIALDPALVAYAFEAEQDRGRGKFRQIAVLCRTTADERDALGQFVESDAPELHDHFAMRGLRAAHASFAAGPDAVRRAAKERLTDIAAVDPAAICRRLIHTVAAMTPPHSEDRPRLVVLGNLDTRNGLELAAKHLLAAPPAADGYPHVHFVGHALATPTTHGLHEIARFASRYKGEWSFAPSIDVVQLLRSVRSGDTLLSLSHGGVSLASAIAETAGCGHVSIGPRTTLRDFQERLADAGVAVTHGEPPVAQFQPGATPLPASWFSTQDLSERQTFALGGATGPVRTLEVIVCFDAGASIDECLSTLRAGPDVLVTALAPAGSKAIRCRVHTFDPPDGFAVGLHDLITGSSASHVMVLDHRLATKTGWAGLVESVTRQHYSALLLPIEDGDGETLHPSLLATSLLGDASILGHPISILVDTYRAHVPRLAGRSLAGLVREIAMRFLLAGERLQDASHPVCSFPPQGADSIRFPFNAFAEAKSLASVAAEAIDLRLADALLLYQGQMLGEAQATAMAPWRRESSVVPALVHAGDQSGSLGGWRNDEGRIGLDPSRYLGAVGPSAPNWSGLPDQTSPVLSLDEEPISPLREWTAHPGNFVCWVVALGRTRSGNDVLSLVEDAVAGLPETHRQGLLSLARRVLGGRGA